MVPELLTTVCGQAGCIAVIWVSVQSTFLPSASRDWRLWIRFRIFLDNCDAQTGLEILELNCQPLKSFLYN